jgi:hypothetical protein
MSADPRKTIFAGMLVCLALGGAGWAGLVRSSRQASAELASLEGQRRTAETEIRRVSGEVAALEKLAASVENASARTGAPASSPGQPALQQAAQIQLVSRDPALGALNLRSDQVYVQMEYGRFFRQQGLSPAEIERFEQNHVDYQQRMKDLLALSQDASDPARQKSAATLLARTPAEHDAAQAVLLRPEGFRQLQEYNRTRSIRNSLVLPLAGTAALQGEPLTQEQAERLSRAAIAASVAQPNASGDELLNGVDWEKFRKDARQILTPVQFDLWSNVSVSSGYPSHQQAHLTALVARAVAAEKAAEPATAK